MAAWGTRTTESQWSEFWDFVRFVLVPGFGHVTHVVFWDSSVRQFGTGGRNLFLKRTSVVLFRPFIRQFDHSGREETTVRRIRGEENVEERHDPRAKSQTSEKPGGRRLCSQSRGYHVTHV